MSVMDRLKSRSRIKDSSVLETSKFFKDEYIATSVPMMNVALSGSLDGGLTSGLLTIAGPSKHFKTLFSLLIAAAYLQAKPKAVLMFYDSEFGSPGTYFKQFGIDTNRVLHIPIKNIEELKFDLVNQLEEMEEKDDVIIIVDSIGNLASKKELDDAINQNVAADMTRAKQLKGLFRMVTPYLRMKRIPMIAINHTYKEQGLFPKDIVSGGTGIYYSSNDIWIVGRRQNKKGTEVTGYDFIINIEKSRHVKEKSKIPITVSWFGGLEEYSGLLDVALATGHVIKPSNGWYQVVDTDTGEVGTKVREKDTLAAEFWDDLLENDSFKDSIEQMYKIGGSSFIDLDVDNEEETEEETE